MKTRYVFIFSGLLAAFGGIQTRAQPPVTLDGATCTSETIISTVKHMIGNAHYPLGGPQVRLLEVFNYRPNPDLDGSGGGFIDTKSPCKVNIMTDRGEFGFTYRWRMINGKVYVEGQFADPDN